MRSYLFAAVLATLVSALGCHCQGAAPASTDAGIGDGSPGDGGRGDGGIPADAGSGDASNAADGATSDAGTSDASSAADGATSTLTILPVAPELTVEPGQALPSVQFSAASAGAAVDAVFSIDRPELGSFGASGLFTASGAGAGVGVVTARWGSLTAAARLTVRLTVHQNGAPDGGSSGDAGSGGWGGVGGEGMGGPASADDEAVLAGTPVADPSISLLYPYDGTVWPKDVLAPLLQWRSDSRDFSAVRIELSGSSYHYVGAFARTATPFIHHPVPQAAWRQLLDSSPGESVHLRIVLASGGTAYGPLEATWKIANGSLKGTVYYNSYGTRLAKNSYGALPDNSMFGGATLAITGGALEPVLVAGGDGDSSQCRVCHVVSATGSRLVTQHGDYVTSSAYDLKSPVQEKALPGSDGRFAFGGISPDGSLLLGNGAPILNEMESKLYALPSGDPVQATGLPSGFKAGTPVFAHDGKKVAFNWYGGSFEGQGADRRSLAVMDFALPGAFSGFSNLYTPSGSMVAIYPSFMPNGSSVVFHLELQSNGRWKFGETRSSCEGSGECSNVGARAELWWVDLATKQAAPLDRLNGKGYLPVGPNGHDQDATLNYEPTVCPVASGGYAWVVFTSRRLYGNVATLNPFWSDPRFHDLSSSPTPKKLWVAALDLNAAPGQDPSHPAFYIPAQELLAGNSRGYWVNEVCRENGASCESGDQCCTGYCRPPSEGAAAICVEKPQGCAREFESCEVTADCCQDVSMTCYGQRCTILAGPN
jgi:hypothetical protein